MEFVKDYLIQLNEMLFTEIKRLTDVVIDDKIQIEDLNNSMFRNDN